MVIILRNLTDKELDSLSDEDKFDILYEYSKSLPYECTIRGLLDEYGIRFDDLGEWVQNFNIGLCNHATRTNEQVYISRHDSNRKDNITINLKDDTDLPYMIVQIQSGDNFIHEEGYTSDGILLYQS